MALPSREVELSVDAVYSVLAFLKRHREKSGPRSIEFHLTPGKAATLKLQPWGTEIESHGGVFLGDKPEVIKIWGRRRLSVLARLLPITERFTVQLLGSGLPSIWTAHLGDMRFVLGLSGWTTNDWTSGSNLELLAGAFVPELRTAAAIRAHLATAHIASFDSLSRLADVSKPALVGSLHHLAQTGQVIFDFASKQYRFREVMPAPLSESVLGPPSPELTAGMRAFRAGGVTFERRELLANGRQLVIARVRTEGGTREGSRCEAVFDADGGYSKATCSCDHFRQFALRKGPCRHLIALKLCESAATLGITPAGEPAGQIDTISSRNQFNDERRN